MYTRRPPYSLRLVFTIYNLKSKRYKYATGPEDICEFVHHPDWKGEYDGYESRRVVECVEEGEIMGGDWG